MFEHNNECRAVEVIGQELVKRGGGALSRGLGAREGSFELPHGNGHSLPRSEGCVLGELRVAGFFLFTVFTVPEKLYCGTVTARKPFSHRGREVTIRKRDVVREKRSKKGRVTVFLFLSSLSWPVWILRLLVQVDHFVPSSE